MSSSVTSKRKFNLTIELPDDHPLKRQTVPSSSSAVPVAQITISASAAASSAFTSSSSSFALPPLPSTPKSDLSSAPRAFNRKKRIDRLDAAVEKHFKASSSATDPTPVVSSTPLSTPAPAIRNFRPAFLEPTPRHNEERMVAFKEFKPNPSAFSGRAFEITQEELRSAARLTEEACRVPLPSTPPSDEEEMDLPEFSAPAKPLPRPEPGIEDMFDRFKLGSPADSSAHFDLNVSFSAWSPTNQSSPAVLNLLIKLNNR